MENTENSSAPVAAKPAETVGGGGKEKVEKQARQLAYDVRYKVKQQLSAKAGGKLDPAAVRKAYMAQLAKSPAAPPVKTRAKQMLLGEDIVNTKELVDDSILSVMNKVFVEGIPEKVEEEVIEESEKATFQVRVTDKETGNTYITKATREKITQLRANPNISSVEMTKYGTPTRSVDVEKGAKAKTSAPKKTEPRHDERKLKSENFDGFLELVEKSKDCKEKKITGNGVNNSKLIKVFPNDKIKEEVVKEQSEPTPDDYNPNSPAIKRKESGQLDSKMKRIQQQKVQVLQKKAQLARQGAQDVSTSYVPELELTENSYDELDNELLQIVEDNLGVKTEDEILELMESGWHRRNPGKKHPLESGSSKVTPRPVSDAEKNSTDKSDRMYVAMRRVKSRQKNYSKEKSDAADRLHGHYTSRQSARKKGASPKEAAAQSHGDFGSKGFSVKRGGRGGTKAPNTDRGTGNKAKRRAAALTSSYELEGEILEAATPKSGTGRYYDEKNPTPQQLAQRAKRKKIKALTDQGKHVEASKLHNEDAEYGYDKEGKSLNPEDKKKESKKEEEDYRGMKTKVELVRNKFRAMGLKMSHEPEGDYINDSIDLAADYFYEQGINEDGVDFIIQEVGLNDFLEFVLSTPENLSEDWTGPSGKVYKTTGKIRSAKKAKTNAPSLQKAKAKADAGDKERKTKGTGEYSKTYAATSGETEDSTNYGDSPAKKVATATSKAKKSQPAKKPNKEGIGSKLKKAYRQGKARDLKAVRKVRDTVRKVQKTADTISKHPVTKKVANVAKTAAGKTARAVSSGADTVAKKLGEAKVDTVQKLDDEEKEDKRNFRKYGTKHNQFMQAVRRRQEHRAVRGDKKIKGQKPAPKGAYGES